MNPHDFIAKYRNAELKERSASQSHFNDLCRLLGVDDPISADPKGEWFTFEKGDQDQRGRRLGRCVAQGVLRLGIQGQGCQSGQGL
nr:hypothetical protein [Novosphingobium percolationis]